MDNITASELAGFGVGTPLLCTTIAAPKVDAFISGSQLSSLGMCKKCGNVRMIACSTCRGTGLVKEGGIAGLIFIDNMYQSLGGVRNRKGNPFLAPNVNLKVVFAALIAPKHHQSPDLGLGVSVA